jgi:hypothetical protein
VVNWDNIRNLVTVLVILKWVIQLYLIASTWRMKWVAKREAKKGLAKILENERVELEKEKQRIRTLEIELEQKFDFHQEIIDSTVEDEILRRHGTPSKTRPGAWHTAPRTHRKY